MTRYLYNPFYFFPTLVAFDIDAEGEAGIELALYWLSFRLCGITIYKKGLE